MAKQAILVEWTESERGWGQRPDGYSVHLNQQAAVDYIQSYQDKLPVTVPNVYTRPDDKHNWQTIKVSDELYAKIVSSDNKSVRLWNHPNEDYPLKPELVYKIRRKSDGLYSTGGQYPSFNHTGKIWRRRNHVTGHLNWVRSMPHVYQDCDLVTFEVVEHEVETTALADYRKSREELQIKREEEAKRRKEELQRKKDEEEFERLAKKLGKTSNH